MNVNEERIAFYYELGLAMSQWALVELTLANLTTIAVSAHEEQSALYMGFVGIENFRSKLQFTERILLDKFKHNPYIGEWQPIVETLRNASAHRNKLAHRMSIIYAGNNSPGRRIALIPWPKPELPKKGAAAPVQQFGAAKPPPGAICLRDINRIRFEFFAIYAALSNFSARLRGRPEPMPKADEQAKNPLSIRTLKCQIHEVLGHPVKPSRRKS